MTLRIYEHIQGIQHQLDILSDSVGFGTGYYRYDTGNAVTKTATEVISQNSKLFKKIKKDEIIIKHAIVAVCRAILQLSGYNDINAFEISINFDDSIIEDKNSISNRALIEYNAGIIDAVEYFKITRDLGTSNAVQLTEEIKLRKEKYDDI
jgi:A118 family predicted phage portal protein